MIPALPALPPVLVSIVGTSVVWLVIDTVSYANTALLHTDGSITAWWPRRWSTR